jgi:hypothetical protein
MAISNEAGRFTANEADRRDISLRGNIPRDTLINAAALDTVRARRRRIEHIRSLNRAGPKRLDYFARDIERAFGISLTGLLAQYAEIAEAGALSEFIAAHGGDRFAARVHLVEGDRR